ncbi:hypothetical protein [Pseudomonas sp. EA_35y_Pfl2_R5]|uniref:hypothetical protein n=1 Tax=Pseudomonas sp. EA_35y_Pfl2_R5 TaxID=3088690 RepID=UPI0030DC50DE
MDIKDQLASLERVVESQEYFAVAARTELNKLSELLQPTPFDVLRCQAFVHAHAGMNDLAVSELNALASQSEGQTPDILNKLAQVKLRRSREDDALDAKLAAERVLALDGLADRDKWLAHQNLGLAFLALGDMEAAESHASKALEHSNDPRTYDLIASINDRNGGVVSFLSTMER